MDDFSSSSAQSDLSTVGLSAEAEALRQTQQSFVDLIDQEAAEEASRNLPPLRSVRGRLREGLTTAVVSLNFAERHDTEALTGLVDAVSEHITEVVANARARRTRSPTEAAAPAVG